MFLSVGFAVVWRTMHFAALSVLEVVVALQAQTYHRYRLNYSNDILLNTQILEDSAIACVHNSNSERRDAFLAHE